MAFSKGILMQRFQILTERRHIMKIFKKARTQKYFDFPDLWVQTSNGTQTQQSGAKLHAVRPDSKNFEAGI